MIKIFAFSFLILLANFSFAKTQIQGKIYNNRGESFYFKPFKDFRNTECPTKIQVNFEGRLSIELEIKKPFFVKFMSNGITFSLFVEPGDSLYFELDPEIKDKNHENWLLIHGNNETGQNIFNKDFNLIPFNKFINIRGLLDKYEFGGSSNKKLEELFLEIEKQVIWLDSLRKNKKITLGFQNYISKDIKAILANEIILITENYLSNKLLPSEFRKRILSFQSSIFNKYSAHDIELRSGLYAPTYIFNYYKILSKTLPINTDNIICEDAPFISLMNIVEQEYFWGFDINAVARFAPESEYLCKSLFKYNAKFPKNSFIEFLSIEEICGKKPKNKSNLKFIDINDTDFFTFIENFKGKRIFVDLWATWCGPCKAEFKNYTVDFYNLLKKYQIEMVFLSIDDILNKKKWHEQASKFNLHGYNGIVNEKLMESIKEILYNSNSISIPRYLLIDNNGKFISWDAPRPSNPNLIKLFEKLEVK